jgi:hypothetical protein
MKLFEKEVFMDILTIIKAIAPLAAVFGIFTFTLHVYQSRLLKKMDERAFEQSQILAELGRILAKMDERTAKTDERSERQSQMLVRIEDTQRYVAELVKIEGEKTREAIGAL